MFIAWAKTISWISNNHCFLWRGFSSIHHIIQQCLLYFDQIFGTLTIYPSLFTLLPPCKSSKSLLTAVVSHKNTLENRIWKKPKTFIVMEPQQKCNKSVTEVDHGHSSNMHQQNINFAHPVNPCYSQSWGENNDITLRWLCTICCQSPSAQNPGRDLPFCYGGHTCAPKKTLPTLYSTVMHFIIKPLTVLHL